MRSVRRNLKRGLVLPGLCSGIAHTVWLLWEYGQVVRRAPT